MLTSRRLFIVLTLIGAISGFVLGELLIGRGFGVYVGSLSALVGLLLAWALWRTRPQANGSGEQAAEPPSSPTPQWPRGATNVRVRKSQQGGKPR